MTYWMWADVKKDVSDFLQGPNHYGQTAGLEHLQSDKACEGLPLSSGKNLPTVGQGGANHEPATGCWVHEGDKGYLSSSKGQKGYCGTSHRKL